MHDARAVVECKIRYALALCNGYVFQGCGNVVSIRGIAVCSEDVSKVLIARSVLAFAYKGQSDALKARAIIERLVADRRHSLRNSNALKTRTGRERAFSNCCNTAVHSYALKPCAVAECVVANGGNARGYDDLGQSRAAAERISADACKTPRENDALKSRAAVECIFTYVCNALWEVCALKRGAVIECVLSNTCNALGENDVFNITAIVERVIANARGIGYNNRLKGRGNVGIITRVAVCSENISEIGIARAVYACADKGQRYAFKRGAACKCLISNACNAIGYYDALKSRASVERFVFDGGNSIV